MLLPSQHVFFPVLQCVAAAPKASASLPLDPCRANPPCPPAGSLPADLPQLASQRISVANNLLRGSLPVTWSSDTLEVLDLGNNVLSSLLLGFQEWWQG